MSINVKYSRHLNILLISKSLRRSYKKEIQLFHKKLNLYGNDATISYASLHEYYQLCNQKCYNIYDGIFLLDYPEISRTFKYLPILKLESLKKGRKSYKFNRWIEKVNKSAINKSSISNFNYEDVKYNYRGNIYDVNVCIVAQDINNKQLDVISTKIEKLMYRYGVEAKCNNIISLSKLMRIKKRCRYQLVVYVQGLVENDESNNLILNNFYTKLPILTINANDSICYENFILWIKPFYDSQF